MMNPTQIFCTELKSNVSGKKKSFAAFGDQERINLPLAGVPVFMSTSGRIHSEFLRLLYFLADPAVAGTRQAKYAAPALCDKAGV